MASQRVGDMTLDELNELVESIIDRRLQGLLKPQDSRSHKELLEELKKLRYTSPAGTKSASAMIREDRDA